MTTKPKPKPRKANLQSGPHIINRETWFYNEPKNLTIIHEIRTDSGDYIRTDHIYIPWKTLRKHIPVREVKARIKAK